MDSPNRTKYEPINVRPAEIGILNYSSSILPRATNVKSLKLKDLRLFVCAPGTGANYRVQDPNAP
jgi:hypothetical protein